MNNASAAPSEHYTIGQLSQLTGVKAVTIRYYEKSNLLPPASRTASGYRLYSSTERDRLHFIKRCRHLGLGLDDIKSLLQLSDEREAPCQQVGTIIHHQRQHVRDRIRDLQALEQELDRLERACRAETIGECKIIESLSRHADH